MNSNQIYHLYYGQGSILSYSQGTYTINFDTVGIKKFESTGLGKYLFLKKSDYDIEVQIKNVKHISKYTNNVKSNELKEQKTKNIEHHTIDNIEDQYNKMLQQYKISYPTKAHIDNFILPDINNEPLRNIVIVLNSVITLKNKKYLNLIGIDVFTGIVVKIVDTNGSINGYHSYSSELYKIKPYTVIKAQFTNYNSNKELNIIRIKSPIKILGKSNLSNLNSKYQYITSKYNVNFHTFVYSFESIKQFYTRYKCRQFNLITLFKSGLIKKYNNKYQLLMGDIFIDIENPDTAIILNKPGFCGYVLLNINCCFDRPRIIGYLLSGKFISEVELNQMKKDNEYKRELELEEFIKTCENSNYYPSYYDDWEENEYSLYWWDE